MPNISHNSPNQSTDATPTSASSSRADKNSVARILSLRLLTAAPLAKMKDFYHGRLGLPVLEEQSDQITIGAGATPITFVNAGHAHGEPFYHFAFNIPENKLLLAREWQRERAPLILSPPNRRDPRYPDDVRHFPNWNAHSVFFWDAANNIVEYIARHDLKNSDPGPFTSEDILYASEIGFVVDDVSATALKLKKDLALSPYPLGTDHLWAMGDEHSLLLVLKEGLLWGANTDSPKKFDVFPTVVGICGVKPTKYVIPDYPYEIIVE